MSREKCEEESRDKYEEMRQDRKERLFLWSTGEFHLINIWQTSLLVNSGWAAYPTCYEGIFVGIAESQTEKKSLVLCVYITFSRGHPSAIIGLLVKTWIFSSTNFSDVFFSARMYFHGQMTNVKMSADGGESWHREKHLLFIVGSSECQQSSLHKSIVNWKMGRCGLSGLFSGTLPLLKLKEWTC